MNYSETFQSRGHLYNQATALAPDARSRERDAIIRRLNLKPDMSICDIAAGGGYVAEGILKKLHPQTAKIICVEPSANFAKAIPSTFEVICAPLDDIPLADESVDAIVNLASLHHVENRHEVYREWTRILKENGEIVIADVQAGTATGQFLNTIVDRHTPGGHKGKFLETGELTESFDLLGYKNLNEDIEEVNWTFENIDQMTNFCHLLFGMTKANEEEVLNGINEFLNVTVAEDRVNLSWSLRYFYAQKENKF